MMQECLKVNHSGVTVVALCYYDILAGQDDQILSSHVDIFTPVHSALP